MKKINNNAPTVKHGGSKLKGDIIFIAILLAVLLSAGAIITLSAREGDLVEVYIDGKFYASYTLHEDRTQDIEGIGGVNRLLIRDGYASVEYADCPDGICAAHKPISRSGESIVCLPHKVVITVRSAENNGSGDIDVAA